MGRQATGEVVRSWGATAVRQSGLLPRGDAKSDGGFPKEELPLA
ncbi:hypothetical protein [Dendronalium sp. ChiSLP03b]|nr:hypothetical protein [Dendronalium sp. ChiSLP03b]MDZ8205478.1 hypothetical protein [Dendronalium sp. ChiSLP03b]